LARTGVALLLELLSYFIRDAVPHASFYIRVDVIGARRKCAVVGRIPADKGAIRAFSYVHRAHDVISAGLSGLNIVLRTSREFAVVGRIPTDIGAIRTFSYVHRAPHTAGLSGLNIVLRTSHEGARDSSVLIAVTGIAPIIRRKERFPKAVEGTVTSLTAIIFTVAGHQRAGRESVFSASTGITLVLELLACGEAEAVVLASAFARRKFAVVFRVSIERGAIGTRLHVHGTGANLGFLILVDAFPRRAGDGPIGIALAGVAPVFGEPHLLEAVGLAAGSGAAGRGAVAKGHGAGKHAALVAGAGVAFLTEGLAISIA